MTSPSAGQRKEVSGADLEPGPLGRIHSASGTRVPVNVSGIEDCYYYSICPARGHPGPFGAADKNELHVPSETIGSFRHMLSTWH
ncbi:hypothetical protein PDIG_57000 [Penicillium digitatum PHI26]|uniref:Uncharacterized protein n=2 Tax=Penicillium digitatum TaxID=36651 RepID=K9GAV2_PEND2|nr:hypothetical protein PDIP_66550 [Penicillium digitatum Pd1]EKV09144.1 hypothetical protein PDIP_66550 [Penicillium digitatum Pd1]EKV10411.1 hypothetical protein PDIG_57000 [Penicillium digitatum PHI26]